MLIPKGNDNENDNGNKNDKKNNGRANGKGNKVVSHEIIKTSDSSLAFPLISLIFHELLRRPLQSLSVFIGAKVLIGIAIEFGIGSIYSISNVEIPSNITPRTQIGYVVTDATLEALGNTGKVVIPASVLTIKEVGKPVGKVTRALVLNNQLQQQNPNSSSRLINFYQEENQKTMELLYKQ